MKAEEKVRKAFKKGVNDMLPKMIVSGVVTKINVSKWTCSVAPHDGGPEYHNVRLKPASNSDDIGMLPEVKKGSDVIIAVIYNDDRNPYLLGFSDLTSLLLKMTGGSKIELKDNKQIEINGKSFGGLVKVQELTAQINLLEADINTLKAILAAFNAALLQPTPPATPWEMQFTTAYAAAFTAYAAKILVPTKKQFIENTTVKHGSGN